MQCHRGRIPSEGIPHHKIGVRGPLELTELGGARAAEEVDPQRARQRVRHVVLGLGVHVEVTLVGAPEDKEAKLQRLV